MRSRNRFHRGRSGIAIGSQSAFAIAVALSSAALAADNVSILVDSLNATNGKAISGIGYKPDLDGAGPDIETLYVSAFGVTINPTNSVIRKITGIGGVVASQSMNTEANQRFYYSDGNPSWGMTGIAAPTGIQLNPLQIGTGPGAIPAYSTAWLFDGVTVNPTTSPPTAAETSDRVTRYTLQPITSNADALVQMTSLAQLDDFQSAVGTTNATMNWIRRGAWSTDGQSMYQSDSSTNFGGIWKVNPANGAIQRIVSAPRAVGTTEIEVLPGATGDIILFNGKTGAGNNPGGINFVEYTGTPITSDANVGVWLDGNVLTDFIDNGVTGRSAGVGSIASIKRDESGTVYFIETTSDTIIARDPSGNLRKVTTNNEIAETVGSPAHSSWLRLQTRQATVPGGTRPQVFFTDSNYDAVVAAIDYKPGDFDRDNDSNNFDSADLTPFLDALQPRQQYTGLTGANPLPAPSKFDLNGNRTVDWKDVKILQSFLKFQDGDTNLDGLLNFTDLNTMRDNYYTTASPLNKTWQDGDFASLSRLATTYLPGAADANQVNFVDLQAIAHAWLFNLGLPRPTAADFDANNYTGQFRVDAELAFAQLPEPAGLGVLMTAAALLVKRRRR